MANKKTKRIFYKAFDGNLKGKNDFQFEVGGTYATDTKDNWRWFHYGASVTSTITYFKSDIRICVVEPLGDTRYFRGMDFYNKGYYTTNKLTIVRELTREEIFELLDAEKCPFDMALRKKPPYSYLMRHKNQIRGNFCIDIIRRNDLTYDERKSLLPKSWIPRLDYRCRYDEQQS